VDEACSTHGIIVSRKQEEKVPVTVTPRLRDRMGFKSGLKKRCMGLWAGFTCRRRNQWLAVM